jgi:plastocyanin
MTDAKLKWSYVMLVDIEVLDVCSCCFDPAFLTVKQGATIDFSKTECMGLVVPLHKDCLEH